MTMNDQDDFKIDFVGIGAPKCATTWIYECLKEHPKICMPRLKSTCFFDQSGFSQQRLDRALRRCQVAQKSGEFSPTYLYQERIVQQIKLYNPDIKLIVSLKDPTQRTYSHYLHRISLHSSKWSGFLSAVKQAPIFTEHSFYYKYLKNYFDNFPKEQILVLFTEDIKKDPHSLISRMYDFLEVDSSFVPKIINHKVSPTAFKTTYLGKFIHKALGQPLQISELGKLTKNIPFVRRFYLKLAEVYSSDKDKPIMSEEASDYLHSLFQEDITKLERLIDKDLSHWK